MDQSGSFTIRENWFRYRVLAYFNPLFLVMADYSAFSPFGSRAVEPSAPLSSLWSGGTFLKGLTTACSKL